MKSLNANSFTPAHRVNDIKEYFFSKKRKEVAELNARGANVISLAIGGPDLSPEDGVIRTLCTEANKRDSHGYQAYTGLPELRQAYAKWYHKFFNVQLDPQTEILPLIGSKEGVLHISLTFLNPGDTVLIPNPGYPTYTSVSIIVGATIQYYDLTPENNWEPNFNELERYDLEGVKLMWVNYPNMPTGKCASTALFKKLVEFGRRHNIVIVNDNPYSFILNDEQLSILAIDGAKDVAIELNSLSKSHNMPGWRMGMAASNATFINWILKVKSNIDSGQFKPMMKAAVAALACGNEWYARLNKVYSERRIIAEQIMTTLGCTFDASQRGLFLWGRIPTWAAGSAQLADELLHDAGVFVTPGYIFGSNGEQYLRLSLCATTQALQEANIRIESYMQRRNKKKNANK